LRLRKFRVQAFRCIHDSGDIVVGDLAAFVGRNESGKTTILQALTMLDKDEFISELDLCDEMTERLKSEIRIVEGDFELNQDETEIVKEKFPGLQLKKLKIFRTNKNPEIQYDFGDIKIDQKEDENLEYWQNITKQLSNFVESIPNYISKKLDTDFFTGNTPKDKKIIQAELDEFDNTLQAIATEEQQVISEWEETYTNIIKNVEKILIDNTESEALKNFIMDNLHPRFVYFSDYKKILGNINLTEYIKESENGAAAGIESVTVNGNEIEITYCGLGGGGVGATTCRAYANGVLRYTLSDSGGGKRATGTIVVPRRERVLVGIDNTDSKEEGATWSLAHNIAAAVDAQKHKYISHTLVQLYPVPQKTQNCVSTVLEFACVDGAKNELLDGIKEGLEKYSVSRETGMVVLSDFDASCIMDYSRLCRSQMITKELTLKTARANDVEIYMDGNGIIGALAALPWFSRNDESVIM